MSNANQTLTAVASGDLSANQYYFVRYAAQDVVYLASSGGAMANIGILQNQPANGEHASVVWLGSTFVKVGSSVSANDMLMSTAGGTATTAVSGQNMLARALTAGSPGDIIPCVVFPVVQLAR